MPNDMGRNSGVYPKQNQQEGARGKSTASYPPQGYLEGGYFTQVTTSEGERKVIRREYIIDYAKAIAQKLIDDGKDGKNKSTQLRKFYDYCVQLDSMMKNGSSFEEVEGAFCQLLPYAEDAQTRKCVTDTFVKFIQDNVEQVHNKEDFNAFLSHFEAVIAFRKK